MAFIAAQCFSLDNICWPFFAPENLNMVLLYIIGNLWCHVLASKGHSVPATNHCATWQNLEPKVWGVEMGRINYSWLCCVLS